MNPSLPQSSLLRMHAPNIMRCRHLISMSYDCAECRRRGPQGPVPDENYGTNHTQSPELPWQRSTHQEDSDAPLRHQLEQHTATGAPRAQRPKAEDSKRFLVRVTSVRGRLIDEDNLCEKYIVDCCRYAGLLPGDSPAETKIEVCQRKVSKGEEEHTLIEIYTIDTP